MQKLLVCVLALAVAASLATAQDKRIYNDGEVDHAPAEARFELSATEFESDLAEIVYSVNGGELMTYNGSVSLSEEGRNVITYSAVDVTGNVSSERAYTVVIDKTPPELTGTARGAAFVEDGLGYVRSDTVISLDATDNLSGVWAIYVSRDGDDFYRYGDFAYVPGEGAHTAWAYAVDNVGNRSVTYRVSGHVDNTPPTVRIFPRRPLSTVNGERFTSAGNALTVRASDEIAGVDVVMVSMNGGPYETYGGPLALDEPGRHMLRAKALDRLGNESEPVSLELTVDAVTPEPEIRAIIGN